MVCSVSDDGQLLNELGFIGWFSDMIKVKIGGLSWQVAFPVIILVYFFSHYIFASATAHVAAMYAALLGVGVSLGIPPMLLAMMLGFMGSIYGVLTLRTWSGSGVFR